MTETGLATASSDILCFKDSAIKILQRVMASHRDCGDDKRAAALIDRINKAVHFHTTSNRLTEDYTAIKHMSEIPLSIPYDNITLSFMPNEAEALAVEEDVRKSGDTNLTLMRNRFVLAWNTTINQMAETPEGDFFAGTEVPYDRDEEIVAAVGFHGNDGESKIVVPAMLIIRANDWFHRHDDVRMTSIKSKLAPVLQCVCASMAKSFTGGFQEFVLAMHAELQVECLELALFLTSLNSRRIIPVKAQSRRDGHGWEVPPQPEVWKTMPMPH